jgi:hypothetical protein
MRIFGRDQLVRSDVPVVDRDRLNNSTVEEDVEARHAPISTDESREKFTENAQGGVLEIEAITTVWTKTDLILAYVL